MVESFGIVGRDHDGSGPLEAVFENAGASSVGQVGLIRDVAKLPGTLVITRDQALIVGRIDDVRVRRIGRDVARFSTADWIPVGTFDGAVIAAGGDGDGAVVLLRTVDVVGRPVVGNHVVELRRRLIVLPGPGLALVERDGHAAVVGGNHAFRIFGINP